MNLKKNNINLDHFFPDHWSVDTVVDKIREAFHNQIAKPVRSGSRQQLLGITSEGLEIELIVENTGELVSAYPKL